jgi:hypothetical protein
VNSKKVTPRMIVALRLGLDLTAGDIGRAHNLRGVAVSSCKKSPDAHVCSSNEIEPKGCFWMS